MSMTHPEIVRLLQVITVYDGRDRGADDARAWQESADRARWTFGEALNAVHEHFAHATGEDWWIKPGHITERIRTGRRAKAEQHHSEQVARDAHRMLASGGDDPHDGQRNSPELESLHTEAMTQPCSHCHADTGHRCTNPITGNSTKIPHTSRSKTARDRVEADGGRSVFRR